MANRTHDGILATLEGVRDNLAQVVLHTSYSGIRRAVVIFGEDPANIFTALRPLVKFIKMRRLPEPLIVNRDFVLDSLDSFPLEFLDIQSACEPLLTNADVLAGLEFARADIRLQMERELKSKWLLTRQAVLEDPFHTERVAKVVQISRGAIHPVLKGFFALVGQLPPLSLTEAVQNGAAIAACDLSPLLDPITGLEDVNRYIDMLAHLCRRVQGWQL